MEMGKLIEVIGVKLVSYLFTSLIMYGIFRKTGEDKYKAFIPYYRIWVFYKLIDLSKLWFCLYIITCVLGYFANVLDLFNIKILGNYYLIIPFVSFVISVVLGIFVSDQLGNSFGKTRGFKIGYFFLPTIFGLIAAFDKSEYLGPNGR